MMTRFDCIRKAPTNSGRFLICPNDIVLSQQYVERLDTPTFFVYALMLRLTEGAVARHRSAVSKHTNSAKYGSPFPGVSARDYP